MSSAKPTGPSKSSLLKDLSNLAKKHPGAIITRNFYRANGSYKEADWQKYFPNFSAFAEAAEVPNNTPKQAEKADEVDETVGDTRTISLPKTRIHTLEELLEHSKVDLSVWKV